MRTKRVQVMHGVAAAAAMMVFLAACGDAPFNEVGNRSTDWIGNVAASSTTSTTVAAEVDDVRVAALALSSAAGLRWMNDALQISDPGLDSAAVAGAVWRRSERADAYVQAHRADIASVLPGVKFPGAIPSSVEHVTSQLVFTPNTGRLAEDITAAFGLWSIPPYSQSRVIGQKAVLLVGIDGSAGEAASELPLPCARAEVADALSCRDISVDGVATAEVQVENGVRFVWWEGGFRYELFYRTAGEPEVGLLMVQSMVELEHVEEQAFGAYRDVASRAAAADDSFVPTS